MVSRTTGCRGAEGVIRVKVEESRGAKQAGHDWRTIREAVGGFYERHHAVFYFLAGTDSEDPVDSSCVLYHSRSRVVHIAVSEK